VIARPSTTVGQGSAADLRHGAPAPSSTYAPCFDSIRCGHPSIDYRPPRRRSSRDFLATAGIRLRTEEASIANLRTLRASYEPYVHSLASLLLMPIPRWIPPEGENHWHTMS